MVFYLVDIRLFSLFPSVFTRCQPFHIEDGHLDGGCSFEETDYVVGGSAGQYGILEFGETVAVDTFGVEPGLAVVVAHTDGTVHTHWWSAAVFLADSVGQL